MADIVNPFAQAKKTNWAKKTQERLKTKVENDVSSKNIGETEKNISKNLKASKKNSSVERVAKSFKIYPGKISRDFDKRVNKLQVHFDDMDFDKNYVDAGKYMMFLMSFAEKFKIYDLYKEVDSSGSFDVSLDEVKKHFKNQ